MKFRLKAGCLLVASLVASAPVVFGQTPKAGMQMPRYNVAGETTITGTVQDVMQPQRGRMAGTHLIVKTDKETIEVHLGPSNFINREGFNFAKGDAVEILGAMVAMGSNDVLIAREVTKDGKKLTLRDGSGRPVWAGRAGNGPCCGR